MRLSLFIPFLAAVSAYAQCPAGVTDPSTLLQGGPWAVQLTSGDFQPGGSAAIGTFTALPGGIVRGNLTTSNQGALNRRIDSSGRYFLYGDCTGGEIMLSVNSFSVQLEFVWSNNFTQLLFVSDEYNSRFGGSQVFTGNALRAPIGCPAGLGVNTINLLNGTAWSFRLSPGYYFGTGGASAGIIRPIVNGNAGILTAIETTNTGGTVVRRQSETGRYQVYSDCSGGEIMLMNRSPGAAQLEYVFVGPNFDQIFFLNDSSASNNVIMPLAGQAFRF